jgi:hypothetical protein
MQNFRESKFVEADFHGAQFRGVDFSKVKISDAWLVDVDISGTIAGLTVNGVDVTDFVEQQLDERHPTRKLLRATDPDSMRQTWSALEQAGSDTLARAHRLPREALDESVDDEWSYLQTLRHLVYATDRWISGPVLDDPNPFHPLGLPNPSHGLPVDLLDAEARPTIDEVLIARRDRMSRVARYLAAASTDQLDSEVESPNGGMASVRRCFQVVFREEWWHDQYAQRDLTVLERRLEQ